MNVRYFITHTLAILLTVLSTSVFFALYVMPQTSEFVYVDPHKIVLSPSEEPRAYLDVARQNYLGQLFLKHPLYFYKRETGYNQLAELAKQGYTPAASNLYTYHINEVYKGPHTKKHANEQLAKAYKWAKLAGQQGSFTPLSFMALDTDFYVLHDPKEDIQTIEDIARKSSISGPAKILSRYYAKQENTEKANEWQNIAGEIEALARPAPTCTTITPWRGW